MKKSKIIVSAVLITQACMAMETPIILDQKSQNLSEDVGRILGVMAKKEVMTNLQNTSNVRPFKFKEGVSIPVSYMEKPYRITAMDFETYDGSSGSTMINKGMRSPFLTDLGKEIRERLPFALSFLPAKLDVTVDYENVTAFTFSFYKDQLDSRVYGDCHLTFYAQPQITLSKGATDFFASF